MIRTRVVLAALLMSVTSVASADTVVMKSGKTYNGKIKVTEDTSVVVIRSEGIDWTLPSNQVASKETNEEGTEEAGLQPAPPAPIVVPPKGGKTAKNKKGDRGL